MASGQSNMQWPAGKSNCAKLAEELSAETAGKVAPIREFQVTSVTSQLHPIRKATGAWQEGSYKEYSAIALAFAHTLYKELNVPIGILNCSFSQTSIQTWIPREGFATATDDYSKAIHLKGLQTDPTTPEHKEAWDAFYTSLEDPGSAWLCTLSRISTLRRKSPRRSSMPAGLVARQRILLSMDRCSRRTRLMATS